MHSPQHAVVSSPTHDRPVIHRSPTQQRYAKSRFLMRLPRRHAMQHHHRPTATTTGDASEGGDGEQHASAATEEYDFVDSLLEAEEDTTFIDNLIGASRKKQDDDCTPNNHHHHHHSNMMQAMETSSKLPLQRRFRIVGRKVMYSLGTFIITYSILSFWQSRKTNWAWSAYKENMNQNFAAFPEHRGGQSQHQQHHQQLRQPQQQQQQQQRQFSSSNQGRMYNAQQQPLSSQQQQQQQLLQQQQNLRDQQYWAGRGEQEDPSAFRQETSGGGGLSRLSSPQLSTEQFILGNTNANNINNNKGRFSHPLNAYPDNVQQLPNYGLVNPSLSRGGNTAGFSSSSAASVTAGAWIDNKAGASSLSSWQGGRLPSMNLPDSMESANMVAVARPLQQRQQQQQQRQQQQQQQQQGGDGAGAGSKRRKGWRLLRQKEKSEATNPLPSSGNSLYDTSTTDAAVVVKSALLLDPRTTTQYDTTAGSAGGGAGAALVRDRFVVGNNMNEIRQPYTHGYD